MVYINDMVNMVIKLPCCKTRRRSFILWLLFNEYNAKY